MDPRLDRTWAALAAHEYGRILAMDATGENGDESASLSERVLALMTHDFSSELRPAGLALSPRRADVKP